MTAFMQNKEDLSLLLLPAELTQWILRGLDRKDALNLRLTCKSLRAHATPLAFEVLHVWLEEGSLRRLLNIGRQSNLRHEVTQIEFGMDLFYKIDYEQFKEFIYSPLELSGDNSDVSPPRKAAWRVYQSKYQKQVALDQSGQSLAMMTEALAAFPSLVSIDMVDFQSWTKNCNGPRLLKQERFLRTHMLTVPNHGLLVPRGGQQLQLLMKAWPKIINNVRELSLQIYTQNIRHDGLYAPFTMEIQQHTNSALAGLRRLDLVLQVVPLETMRILRSPEPMSLTGILRAASNLESLYIDFPTHCYPAWDDFIRIHRFGRLKHLHIDGPALHEADFASFILGSCWDLEELHLGEAKVVDGSWDLVFNTIRQLPRLNVVELYCLWYRFPRGEFVALEGMDEQPLYDFLLKKRADNPWDKICQARFWEEDTSGEESTEEGGEKENL